MQFACNWVIQHALHLWFSFHFLSVDSPHHYYASLLTKGWTTSSATMLLWRYVTLLSFWTIVKEYDSDWHLSERSHEKSQVSYHRISWRASRDAYCTFHRGNPHWGLWRVWPTELYFLNVRSIEMTLFSSNSTYSYRFQQFDPTFMALWVKSLTLFLCNRWH